MCVNYSQLTLTLILTTICMFVNYCQLTLILFLFRGFCPQGVLSGYRGGIPNKIMTSLTIDQIRDLFHGSEYLLLYIGGWSWLMILEPLWMGVRKWWHSGGWKILYQRQTSEEFGFWNVLRICSRARTHARTHIHTLFLLLLAAILWVVEVTPYCSLVSARRWVISAPGGILLPHQNFE